MEGRIALLVLYKECSGVTGCNCTNDGFGDGGTGSAGEVEGRVAPVERCLEAGVWGGRGLDQGFNDFLRTLLLLLLMIMILLL